MPKDNEIKRVIASLEGEQIVVNRHDATLMEWNQDKRQWFDKAFHGLPMPPGVIENWTDGWNQVDRSAALAMIRDANTANGVPPPRSDRERLNKLEELLRSKDEAHEFWYDPDIGAFCIGAAMGDDVRQALDNLLDGAQ